MTVSPHRHRVHPLWWALLMVALIAVFLFVTIGSFAGIFRPYVPVILVSDRAGLVMEANSKVSLRGVEIGRVSQISNGTKGSSLKLEIDRDRIRYIPSNVEAQIKATTVFGTKFVELTDPPNPSPEHLAAGAVLHSSNVSTEVNTVFQDVVDLLDAIDPLKLNSVLTALADGVRGQGERMGQAATDLKEVLEAVNPRSDIIRNDLRSLRNFSDTFDAGAQNIVSILDSASTTSITVAKHSTAVDALLLNAIGFSQVGTNLLTTSGNDFVATVNALEPTTNMLLKYSPEYACTLQGATWYLEHGGYDAWGGRDRQSLQFDFGLSWGADPYVFPENLPIVAAKGGPDGRPGCGSLPDITKNFPVRQLVTNTGWGTGMDIRPNPGIGHPCWADFFPVTRAVPEAPSIRQCLPGPAPGPDTGPGSPPYGAAWYGPDGAPLWPGVVQAPAPGPAMPAPEHSAPNGDQAGEGTP